MANRQRAGEHGQTQQQPFGKRCTVGSPDNYNTRDNQKCSKKGRNVTCYCPTVSERKQSNGTPARSPPARRAMRLSKGSDNIILLVESAGPLNKTATKQLLYRPIVCVNQCLQIPLQTVKDVSALCRDRIYRCRLSIPREIYYPDQTTVSYKSQPQLTQTQDY